VKKLTEQHHLAIERVLITLTFLLVLSAVLLWQWNRFDSSKVHCYQFKSQAAAQVYYREHPRATWLDIDADGIACESGRVPLDLTPVER